MLRSPSTHALIALALAAVQLPRAASGLASFPGAKGHGAKTPGGRGGAVVCVTNLNDDGAGSLREACRKKGPRIIVFKVGGVIQLERNIAVTQPYATMAGQTAPGDGICVAGAHMSIPTHNVIIRGMRFRIGDSKDGPNPDNRDGIGVANKREAPHDIIIDHCSVCWAIDENIQTWYPCHDITVQWCISSEALSRSLHPKGEHSKGFLIGDHTHRISVHHNLFAHNMRRNPLLKAGTSAEVVNNVIYNWGNAAIHHSNYEKTDEPILAHHVANYFVKGPDSRNKEITLPKNTPPGSRIYIRGNYGPNRKSRRQDEWSLVSGPTESRILRPIRELHSVDPESAHAAYITVLKHAGATAPERDAIDTRIVRSVVEGKGEIIDSQKQVGGLPEYRPARAAPDRDMDGMPDAWESQHRLNPRDARDGAKVGLSREGYTNVEVYVNGLFE